MDGESVTAEEELAELVVAQVAPAEQELFGVISEVYRRDPHRFRSDDKARDEMLGFGVEAVAALLTPVVLAAAAEVIRYLTEAGIRNVFRRKSGGPELSAEQLARIRQIVRAKCDQGGVRDGRSELIADGVVGALTRSA